MLRIEATRGERWGSMALTSLYLLMGIATLLLCVVGYAAQPEPYPILVFAFIPLCAYQFLAGGTRLYLDWFRGRIRTRVLIDDRQLVVFRRGQQAMRVRKRDVEAVAHVGWVLVKEDGTRCDLRTLWGNWGTAQNMRAIEALYSSWWPHLQRNDIRDYFARHDRPSVAVGVFLPLLPIYFLLGWIAHTQWGELTLIPLVVIVMFHSAVTLWCALRNERRLLFYVDRISATMEPTDAMVTADAQD